jgi:hypothetical protein
MLEKVNIQWKNIIRLYILEDTHEIELNVDGEADVSPE